MPDHNPRLFDFPFLDACVKDREVSALVIDLLYGVTDRREDIREQKIDVHDSEQADCGDEKLAEFAAALFIGDKVAEAHHQVECDQGDDLIEGLDICGESGFHGMRPVQQNDDEHRGHQLDCNLAPEEFDPEDADKCKAESSQKVSHGHKHDIPFAFLVRRVLKQ